MSTSRGKLHSWSLNIYTSSLRVFLFATGKEKPLELDCVRTAIVEKQQD